MSYYRRRKQPQPGNGYRRFYNTTRGIANVASTAATALKIATTVAGLINVEFKHVDLASSLNPSNSGAILSLSQVAQGDGVQNRDGNQIEVKSLRSKFTLERHASATGTWVRMIYFIDNQPTSGSVPSVTDVLTTADPSSLPHFDNRRRFTILADRTFNLHENLVAHGDYYKRLNMKHTFDGTASNTLVDNALYLLYLSNEATNTPTLLIKHRVRFIDN